MSSCSFASYIQMRTAAFCSSPVPPSSPSSPSGPTSVAPSPTATTAILSPLVHLAPSPVPSADSASPHKRQRNRSPDHSSLPSSHSDSPADSPTTPTVATVAAVKSGPKVDPLSYFFASSAAQQHPHVPFHHHHPVSSSNASSASASASSSGFSSTVPTTAAPSPVCPLRSILCTSHFDETGTLVTASSSATSSPPISRPLSRRSSTSTSTTHSHSTTKSVRFARCTNASVFPTHSTEEYDRSPIVPTCEAESLEIYRCKAEGEEGEEGGGWIMCHAAKKAGAAPEDHEANGGRKKKALAPAVAGAASMPVEGVRGLFAGSYFEGEERDHPLFPASTPACGSAGVVIPEMVGEEEEDDDDGILGEGIGDDGELMEVDDSAEDVDAVASSSTSSSVEPDERERERDGVDVEVEAEVGAMELLAVSELSDQRRSRRGSDSSAHSAGGASSAASSASSATSTEESHPHRASSPSTPTSSPPAELAAPPDADDKDKAQRCAERKKRFGLIGLGKYTRQELFQSHDSLSGF